jgi:hypothetical protein
MPSFADQENWQPEAGGAALDEYYYGFCNETASQFWNNASIVFENITRVLSMNSGLMEEK